MGALVVERTFLDYPVTDGLVSASDGRKELIGNGKPGIPETNLVYQGTPHGAGLVGNASDAVGLDLTNAGRAGFLPSMDNGFTALAIWWQFEDPPGSHENVISYGSGVGGATRFTLKTNFSGGAPAVLRIECPGTYAFTTLAITGLRGLQIAAYTQPTNQQDTGRGFLNGLFENSTQTGTSNPDQSEYRIGGRISTSASNDSGWEQGPILFTGLWNRVLQEAECQWFYHNMREFVEAVHSSLFEFGFFPAAVTTERKMIVVPR